MSWTLTLVWFLKTTLSMETYPRVLYAVPGRLGLTRILFVDNDPID